MTGFESRTFGTRVRHSTTAPLSQRSLYLFRENTHVEINNTHLLLVKVHVFYSNAYIFAHSSEHDQNG